MRRRSRLAALTAAAGAVAAVAPVVPGGAQAASTPRVSLLVVGRSAVLQDPVKVRAGATSVRVSGRSCSVAAGTPLAALEAGRRAGGPAFALRDFGACGRRSADAGGLFVAKVGPDRNRGQDGWVYKVGRKAGSTGAADLAGPFGTGKRLRTGQAVTWFWCVMGSAGCQRTLEVKPAATAVAPGGALTVSVRGYDDRGEGRTVSGAVVALGESRATTGADGRATLTATARAGRYALVAERKGMVRSFGVEVVVG